MTHVFPALVHPRRSRARAAPLVLAALLALAATLLVPATGRARDAAPAVGEAGTLPAPCAPGAHVRWVAPGLATIVPPPGFDPATASDTALACYGVPPRPRDAAGRAHWAADTRRWRYIFPVLGQPRLRRPTPTLSPAMRTVRGIAPRVGPHGPRDGRGARRRPRGSTDTSQCGTGNAIAYVFSPNWAGYVLLNTDNNALSRDSNGAYFTRVEADFTVPVASFPPGTSSPGVVATWVGLGGGGGGSDTIWQAGVNSIVDPAYEFWFENFKFACLNALPNEPTSCYNRGRTVFPLTAPDVSAGQKVRVSLDASRGTYYFYNYSTGWATNTVAVPIDNNNTGQSAEWIVEEPTKYTAQGSTIVYTSFSTATFSNAIAADRNGVAHYLDAWRYQCYELQESGGSSITAVPSVVDAGSHGFSVSSTP